MRLTPIVAALLGGLAGCGGRTCPAPAAPVPDETTVAASDDPMTKRVAEYADATCACTELRCAEDQKADVQRWVIDQGDALDLVLDDPIRAARIDRHGERAAECRRKLTAEPIATDDSVEKAIGQLKAMSDEVCACADKTCADAVLERARALPQPTGAPTEAENQQLEGIAKSFLACHERLTADATPPKPAPDIAAPTAADLPRFLKRVKGRGTLTATIETNLGTFHCALYEKQTPMTVANFVGLATGQQPWADADGAVQKGVPYYDGLRFHRVIPGFMIQGGDPLDEGTGGPGYRFANEIVPSLRHDRAGVLSMANAGPDTNGSQFFITAKAVPFLDDKHTVFGQCAEVELVDTIAALGDSANRDRPRRPAILRRVTISRR